MAAKVCKVINLIDFEMVALSSLPKDAKKKKRKLLNKLGEKLPKNDDVRRENTVKWADIRQLTESFHYYVENSLSLL